MSDCCKKGVSTPCSQSSQDCCKTMKSCKLTLPEGQVDCECICTCVGKTGGCGECNCECTEEKAQRVETADGLIKYQCECTCRC